MSRIHQRKELGCHVTGFVKLDDGDASSSRKENVFWELLDGRTKIKGDTTHGDAHTPLYSVDYSVDVKYFVCKVFVEKFLCTKFLEFGVYYKNFNTFNDLLLVLKLFCVFKFRSLCK